MSNLFRQAEIVRLERLHSLPGAEAPLPEAIWLVSLRRRVQGLDWVKATPPRSSSHDDRQTATCEILTCVDGNLRLIEVIVYGANQSQILLFRSGMGTSSEILLKSLLLAFEQFGLTQLSDYCYRLPETYLSLTLDQTQKQQPRVVVPELAVPRIRPNVSPDSNRPNLLPLNEPAPPIYENGSTTRTNDLSLVTELSDKAPRNNRTADDDDGSLLGSIERFWQRLDKIYYRGLCNKSALYMAQSNITQEELCRREQQIRRSELSVAGILRFIADTNPFDVHAALSAMFSVVPDFARPKKTVEGVCNGLIAVGFCFKHNGRLYAKELTEEMVCKLESRYVWWLRQIGWDDWNQNEEE